MKRSNGNREDKGEITGGVVQRPAAGGVAPQIAPIFQRLSVSDRDGPGDIREHRHGEYEVILVDSGGYTCTVNGVWMRLAPGQGVVLKPGDWHYDRFDVPLRYFGLVFTLGEEGIRSDLPDIFAKGARPDEQRFRMDLRRIRPLLAGIQREATGPDSFSGHVQDALLSAFFWRMLRALPARSLNPTFADLCQDQTFPSRLTRLFRVNVRHDLSLREMAESLHMCESSITHKCRALMGISPRQAFLRCRIGRAQHLLRNTDYSVKEVAAELGYEDPYTFSRTFKKVCGMSPAHWKVSRAKPPAGSTPQNRPRGELPRIQRPLSDRRRA